MYVMEFGKKYRFTAHADYIHPCWAVHIYDLTDRKLVTIIYTEHPTPVGEGYVKVLYHGRGYYVYEFTATGEDPFHIVYINDGCNGILVHDWQNKVEVFDNLCFFYDVLPETKSHEFVVKSTGDLWRFENTWEKIDVYLNGEWQGVAAGWGQAQNYVLMKYYPFDMG